MSTYSRRFLQTHRSVIFILILATALYLYQLGENSLWTDEFISIHRAQRLPQEIDPVRPLYYILLRGWMSLGMSVEWLRGLSVALGVGSVFLVYRLGTHAANEPVGRVAAVLFACSPLVINHVQEVRMYPLGNFLTVLGSLFLLQALNGPQATAISKWAIARVLAVLTIPLSILLLGPDCLIIAWRFRHQWRTLRKFFVGLLFIGAALVPSSLLMAFKAGPDYVNSWTAELAKPGLVAVMAKLTSLTTFWPLATLPDNLAVKALYYAYTMALAVGVVLALSTIRKQPKLLAVTAWALLPAAVMLVFSYLFSPIWTGRYLLFLIPYLVILIAVGFLRMWHRHRAIAFSLIVMYALTVGGGLNQYYNHWDRDNWKAAVSLINENEQANDAIAVYAPIPSPILAVNYYHQGAAPVYDAGHFQGGGDPLQIKRELDKIPSNSGRYWLIYRGFNGNSRANKVIQQTIETQFTVHAHEKFDGPVNVMLITPRLEETAVSTPELIGPELIGPQQ